MTPPFALRTERLVGAARGPARRPEDGPGGVGPGTVVVADGRIAAVLGAGEAVDCPVLDLGACALLPGSCDSHVHVNEPGRTEWEGFDTATHAAAAGGVTSLVDMPLNCSPVTTSAQALAAKLSALAGKLHVDVAYWGGVVPAPDEQLARLLSAGVVGCKAFLVDSGLPEFPSVGEAELLRAMRLLRDADLPLLVHAELDLGGAPAGDWRDYATYLASRPPAWEEQAIALVCRLARQTGCAVHIVHLSAASALPLIAREKAAGVRLTVETCPHYLALTSEEIRAGSTLYKCAPPIREAANREALWQGLRDGVIDLIVSDHSPCTAHLKDLERGNFAEAWGGISSLQLALPVVWTEARRRGFGLQHLARWMAEAPAKLAGLSDKGSIAVGKDADLCVLDPEASFVVEPRTLEMRNKLTPYSGRALNGVVRQTYLRGEKIFDAAMTPPFPGAPRGRSLLAGRALFPDGGVSRFRAYGRSAR